MLPIAEITLIYIRVATRWRPETTGKMARAKITKRLIDSLQPQADRYVIYDTEVKGFGVRMTPSGDATYIAEYRTPSSHSSITR